MLNSTHFKRHPTAIVIAAALSASSALSVRPAAAQVCASFPTPPDCVQFNNHPIANNSFIVENNAYNDNGQCIQWKTDGSFCLQNAPPTIGYPNILQGNVFGNGPTAGWSPLQVSSIFNNWPITWTVGGVKPFPTGNFRVMFDFWLTTFNPTGINVGQPDGAEIVVSLFAQNANPPDGLNVLDHAFIGGVAWDVYAGRWSNPTTGQRYNRIVYLPRVALTAVNTDFSPFFVNAQDQDGIGTNAPLGQCQNATSNNSQCVDRSWFVTSAQAGFAASGGGVGLTSSNFTSHPNTTPPHDCGRLTAGMRIAAGQAMDSCDAESELFLQTDNNLVIHNRSLQTIWASGTLGSTGIGSSVLMQSDGNLVLYDVNNHALWNTGTVGHPGAYTHLQFGGGSVIGPTGILWYSQGALTAGAELLNNGFMYSDDGRFKLAVQGGNLVLTFGSQVLWTRGNGTGAAVIMQGEDGNLVLYDAARHPLWASNTAGNPGANLSMTNDGNLIIFSATGGRVLWQSGTGGH